MFGSAWYLHIHFIFCEILQTIDKYCKLRIIYCILIHEAVMKMSYKIIGDSCTDLPEEKYSDSHYTIVPLTILFGQDEIPDDETLDQGTLLEKMREWPDAPKTACPSPAQYMDRFDDDADNYVVTLSGNLSGSYNAAVQALDLYKQEGGKGNVHIFNSRSASSGQAQIAMLVQDLAEKGFAFDEVVAKVESYISRMQTLFVLENLENLRKNGRLTKMQSIVTGALRVKLLCAATREGEIEKLTQGLTVRQTLVKMVNRIAEDAEHVGRRLVLSHCNCRERAEYVRDMIRERCNFSEIHIVNTNGIATVYANDGGIIAAY